MRKPISALAAVVLVAAALGLAGPGHAETATLTVTGQGSASAAPDIGAVRAAVETDGKTAAEALATNSALAAQVIETLKAAGVAARDIRTSGLIVQPLYGDSSGSQRRRSPEVVGYRVINAVMVTIRDPGAMGAVLDSVVRSGANRIDSISFGLSDDSALGDEARRAAVTDAKRRASVLAEAAGVALVRVLSIADGGAGGPPVVLHRGAMMAEAAAVPIETGESTVRANVTMVWEIGPAGQ
jgi:uncharacterized protein YggE